MRLFNKDRAVIGYLFIHLLKENYSDSRDSMFARFADLLLIN